MILIQFMLIKSVIKMHKQKTVLSISVSILESKREREIHSPLSLHLKLQVLLRFRCTLTLKNVAQFFIFVSACAIVKCNYSRSLNRHLSLTHSLPLSFFHSL